MREIKFRQPLFNVKGEFRFHYWGFIDGEFISPSSNIRDAQERSQQFTGLKDKNGVEIYEGDILEYRTYSQQSKNNKRGHVFWEEDRWGLMDDNSVYKYNGFSGVHKMNVIGNIYEQ